MANKTLKFLPTVFQTTANQKFLNATLDQLVSEPNFKKVNGYIGRKFAPTFKPTDNYLPEPSADRQNYQLEPSVVVQRPDDGVKFFSTYMDLIQQIEYYGGNTANHSRLFNNEAYTFNGCIDFDKLINFNQYYWLPTGAEPVDVFPGNVDDSREYKIIRDTMDQAYKIDGFGSAQNPTIYLARGGSYNFIVNQDTPFWLQTDPGTDGKRLTQRNINTREVFGVSNNGASNGVITFDVPQIDAQDDYVSMPEVRGPGSVPAGTPSGIDYGTLLKFNDIDNQDLDLIIAKGGIDKETNPVNLHGKYLVFLTGETDDAGWDERGMYAFKDYAVEAFDQGELVPRVKRGSVWRIEVIDTGSGDYVVNLQWDQNIPINSKVFIKSGFDFANSEYYKNNFEMMVRIPLITAPLKYLYYNDGVDQHYFGRIAIVEKPTYQIDIERDIIGHSEYVSPNGVVFTNGLKIKFGSLVIPASYGNNTYYVEGVGTSIKLVKESYLITPELDFKGVSIPFDLYGFSAEYYDQNLSGPIDPDYLTINRSSMDFNPWSRSNRWVHADVITQTAKYNNTIPIFDQSMRAARPIIEFNPNLQLFNFGRVAKHDVDVLDFTVTDALNEIEGKVTNYFTESKFKDGMTVVFAKDNDPTVRNKIWKVNVLDINGEIKIHLTHVIDGNVAAFNIVTPKAGTTVLLDEIQQEPTEPIFNPPLLSQYPTEYEQMAYSAYVTDYEKLYTAWEVSRAEWSKIRSNPDARRMSVDNLGIGILKLDGVIGLNTGLLLGRSFWYTGTQWVIGPEKLATNISPKFDIVDIDGDSFGDQQKYKNTSFTGCDIFAYKKGSGVLDKVLNLQLSYRNFNNIGDIEFTNSYDTDTFTELDGLSHATHLVNSGFITVIESLDTITTRNVWDTVLEKTKQYQIISNVCTGRTSYYEVDILPVGINVIPTIRVFLNNVLLDSSQYVLLDVKAKKAVRILTTLAKGDKIDIQIYANTPSSIGYYEIPQNLNFNALNDSFSTLTLGQFRNHLTEISRNSTKVVGQVPGTSNMRDLNITANGGNILQHSAPTVYSSLFLLNKEINFVDGVTLAQREYTRFKNRFLEMFSEVVDSQITDPVIGVDFIMTKLNVAKNSQTPWYYSDMVPYDTNRTVINYDVLDLAQSEYEITDIYNDTKLSNVAILVYLNNVQLVKGVDYSFNQTRRSIVMTTALQYDDVITITQFNNTDGCFVPETPTKLGLYPKFTPTVFVDSTYSTPFTAIRGHDGSVTPTFGDIRDGLLLELEKRIYNNIKTVYAGSLFDIHDYIPGKFRDTEYTRAEFNEIVSTSFLSWVGSNKVDYTTNQWFQSSNPWTWTYNRFTGTGSSEFLPGHWRGIYQYYYDTDAPHVRPWECLGFSEQPDWWVNTYGPAPYTGGNLVLWQDLEAGRIKFGDRAGIAKQYARPGLTNIIPVTDTGLLRNPHEFLVTQFNGMDVSGAYEVGDNAPVESAWRKSSDYPFAIQQAIALMKPGVYFGMLANTTQYTRSKQTGQIVMSATNGRVTPKDIQINGELVGTTITRAAGYLNWVIDYITHTGATAPVVLRGYLNNVSVRLGYRAAGFTDKKFLRVLAEQSSPSSSNDSIVIPAENYIVHLHKSSSVSRMIYSAVIVEKTNTGYSVSGYNTKMPFFTIIPSEVNSNSHVISVDNAAGTVYHDFQRTTMVIPYGHQFTNKQQLVDFLISYQRYLVAIGFVFEEFNIELQETKNWELSCKEFLTWTQQGWGTGNIIVLSPIGNKANSLSPNAVVDQIDNSPAGSKILDIGFNVVRSSMFTAIRDGSNFSIETVSEITIGLLDLNLVQYEHALIFDNQTVFNDIIYKPELGNRQYRLKMIGNKTDDWAGQLAPPGFVFSNPSGPLWSSGKDYRKGDIVSFKSAYYAAINNVDASTTFNFGKWRQLDNAKFNTGMLPNFSYNAQKFENMYDVDNQVDDQNINAYSNGLIGHRDRGYLTDLSLNSISQVKFYQGYIKDKGTKDAITALSAATFNNLSGNVTYSEEWAFRVGDYGATESNQFLEIQLKDDQFTHAPMAATLLAPGSTVTDSGVVGFYENFLYKKPLSFTPHIFANRDASSYYETDARTAGFVNLNDIDATIFDMTDLAALDAMIPAMHSGFKLWAAKDFARDWNVFRVTEMTTEAVTFTYRTTSTGGFVEVIEFYPSHDIAANDLIMVKGFSTQVDKFYKVSKVVDSNTIEVESRITLTRSQLLTTDEAGIAGHGTVFKMLSMRVDDLSSIASFTPPHGWMPTDNVWVENDSTKNEWAVYNKSIPWATDEANSTLILRESDTVANAEMGTAVAVTEDGLLVATSSPANGNGVIRVFVKTTLDYYAASSILQIDNPAITEIGRSLDIAQRTLVAGAPGSDNDTGQVLVFSISQTGETTLSQVISVDLRSETGTSLDLINAGDRFGHAVSLSKDAAWLYVGAPGGNKVFAFNKRELPTESTEIQLTTTSRVYHLPFTPASTLGLVVTVDGVTLIPNRDYRAFTALAPNIVTGQTGNRIEFVDAPTFTGSCTIVQQSYYGYSGVIESDDSMAGDNFGMSVDTNANGTTIVVGAPNKMRDGVVDVGGAYVFDRYTQAFTANGTDTVFPLSKSVSDASQASVLINGIPVSQTAYTITATTLVFNTAPFIHSDILVNINHFGSPTQYFEPAGLLYNAKFGHAVAISESGTDVFVSAPWFNSNSTHSGVVYRYTNVSQSFNTVAGTLPMTSFSADGIRINNKFVPISGTTPAQIVASINTAGVVGLQAENVNGYLKLSYNAPSAFTSLSVLAGSSPQGLVELGLDNNFVETQIITHPYSTQYEKFGTVLTLNPSTNSLLVGSEGADTLTELLVDAGDTEFDSGVTRLLSVAKNTGSVYIFNELVNNHKSLANPTKYGFVQQLSAGNVTPTDNFGVSIAVSKNRVFVGANHDDYNNMMNSGSVYFFTNATWSTGWNKIRSQGPQVDPYQISKMFLYDRKSQNILTSLDFYDPIKGKLLGVVEQEISYKTSFDPANYNKGTNPATMVDDGYHWGSAQLGQVWWNVDKVRYVDYEQDSLTYRIKNWGKLFPGSVIEVCEWVESARLPSAYKKDGVALYPDDSAYVETVTVDASGFIRPRYYFWVKNKETVSSLLNRRMGVAAIAATIEAPLAQGIPYTALIRDDSVAVFNANSYVSADDTILHIDYAILQNTNIMHNEYELVADSDSSIIPEQIVNKLIDSLTGADESGNMVPDYSLGAAQRYGISIRPRQSMFVNRLMAVKNFVQYSNLIFAQLPICEDFDLSTLSLAEEIPFTWGDPTGKNIVVETLLERSYLDTALLAPRQRILVKSDSDFFGQWSVYEVRADKSFFLVRTQSYKTTDYWHTVDWFSDTYDVTSKPTHTVESDYDIAKLALRIGHTIWVNNNGSGKFVVYRVTGFDKSLANKPDSRFFEIVKTYPTKDALEHDVTPYGIAPGQFALVDTGVADHPDQGKIYKREATVDGVVWVLNSQLSTSAGINGAIGVVSVKDDGNRFFEIAKQYSAVSMLVADSRPEGIVAGQLAIVLTGDPENTDQDKIYQWDGKEFKYVTTLSGTMGLQVRQWQTVTLPNENVILTLVGMERGTIKLSDALWAHDTNQIGFSNDNFDTVKYDLNPTVEFRNIINSVKDDIFTNVLEGKFNKLFFILLDYLMSEQRAVDWVFKTSFISVLHRLRKLGQFPNYIKDNQSFYESYINEVKPYRTKIREYLINYEGTDTGSVMATDFDVPAYYDTDYALWRSPNGEHARDELLLTANGKYANWNAHHTYSIEHVVVSQRGRGYSASVPIQLTVRGGGLPDNSPNHAILEAVIDYYSGELIKVNVLSSGSGYTSTPTIIIPGDGVNADGAQTAVCYPMLTNSTIRSFATTVKFDRVSYASTVQHWAINTEYHAGDHIVFRGVLYTVTDTMSSGTYFNPTQYVVLPASALQTAVDRVATYYNPTAVMLPNDAAQLFTGVEYPGNKVTGETFTGMNSADGATPDTLISSIFTNDGLSPESVAIVGGAFVDTFASHAPEELMPGLMYDTLDIKVFTIAYNETTFQFDPLASPIGYRISKKMSLESATTFDNGTTVFDTMPRWDSISAYAKGDVVFARGRFYSAKYNLGPMQAFSIDDWAATNTKRHTTFNISRVQNPWEFRRICKNAMTRLVKDLRFTDTEIFVEDVTRLPAPSTHLGNPGVVYINGERITYYTMDEATNTLGQIRRGTWGTGTPAVHRAYDPSYDTDGNVIDTSNDVVQTQYASLVVDASIQQEVPRDLMVDINRMSDEATSWLNKWPTPEDGRPLVGDGLFFSTTKQALFLKQCSTYLPWLPGSTPDPTTGKSRFDEGPYLDTTYRGDPAQFDPRLANPSHVRHPFDDTAYDSYRIDI